MFLACELVLYNYVHIYATPYTRLQLMGLATMAIGVWAKVSNCPHTMYVVRILLGHTMYMCMT